MRFWLLFAGMCALCGCGGSPRAGETSSPRPWTHLNFDNDPDHFHFAIVGDRTGQARPGIFEKGIAKLNLLRPEFVMSVGDLIEGYSKDERDIDQQWDEFTGFTTKLDAPFFYVPGNHDLANPIQKEKWKDLFGPAYYEFVYRGVLFLALNTYDPESRISAQQIEFVRDALAKHKDARWICVFMHEPLWDYKQETGWAEVEKVLGDRPYTVFAGHYHTYTKYVRNDRRYLVLATTGGGMKRGKLGADLGAFDHVTWVTMRPEGPLVANIELDAIHDENVRTEAAAKIIEPILAGQAMTISPVFARENFDRASVTLTIKNDADVSMQARGELPAAGGLRASPDTFDVTVPPRASSDVNVDLSAEKPMAPASLQPMRVKWTANFEVENKPIRVPREDVLAAETLSACRARTSPVNIDGNLDEWSELPFGGKAENPDDSSYQFGVEHDDRFVYIAVKVTDDQAVLNALKEPWSQDGVEIRFDARPEPLRSQGRGRGEFREHLVVSMSPAATESDSMVLYNSSAVAPGVQAKCRKIEKGFAAEVAIPVSYLDEKQGGPWSGFRMNVTVDDFDAVAGPLKAHWWRPDWRRGDTFAGSGTFEKK